MRIIRDCAIIIRRRGAEIEPHIGKYYVVPPANKGKLSPDPPPHLPKIMARPQVQVGHQRLGQKVPHNYVQGVSHRELKRNYLTSFGRVKEIKSKEPSCIKT